MNDRPDPFPRKTKLAFFAGAVGAALVLFALFCLIETAGAMPACGIGKRVTCVVDGDTVWIEGERIRLADIDAPEMDGRCAVVSALALRSAARLAELLDGPYTIKRGDPVDGRLHDRHGRTLAVISAGGRSVGHVLVAEGLARPWTGRKAKWC